MLRFLRYTVGLFIALGLLTTVVVYGAKQADDDNICVTLSGSERVILDARRGYLTRETRYVPATRYFIDGTDYVVLAYPDLQDERFARLVLESTTSDEKIVLEESVIPPDSMFIAGAGFQWLEARQSLAYFWRDAAQQEHLTIFSLRDHSKRTALVPQVENGRGNIAFASPSANGDYLMFVYFGNQMTSRYLVFSIATMELVALEENLPPMVTAIWSPDGERVAAIVSDGLGTLRSEDRLRELMIFSPDRPLDADRIPLPADMTQNLVWSPDSQTVALARRVIAREDGLLITRWYFDLYAADGTPLHLNLAGKRVQQSDIANSQMIYRNVIPGFWSMDGASWLYVRDHPEDDALVDWAAVDVSTGNDTVMESGIIASLVPYMFTTIPGAIMSFSEEAPPDQRHILFPLRRDNALTLVYVNYETGQRLTLVEDAREILVTAMMFGSSLIPWGTGDFTIPYVDQEGDTHLRRVSRTDGSILSDIGGMEQITSLLPMYNGIGFIAGRDGAFALEKLNFESGAIEPLLSGVTPASMWINRASNGGQYEALVIGMTQNTQGTRSGSLVMVSPDQEGRVVGENAFWDFLWSPDNSMLAYVYATGVNRRTGVRIIDPEGVVLTDQILPPGALGTWGVRSWNNCAPDASML